MSFARALYLVIKSSGVKDFFLRFRVVSSILLNKDKSKLIKLVISRKQKSARGFNDILVYLFKNASDSELKKLVSKGFNTKDIPQFIVKNVGDLGEPLEGLDSFRHSISNRSRKQQLANYTFPEWKLEHKNNGHKLIDLLGVKRPSSSEHVPLNQVNFREETVIKPSNAHSSMGVYLIHTADNIYDVKKKQKLTSYTELKDSMKKNLFLNEVKEDDWIIEEIIYDNKDKLIPARDLKFLTFYGKVVLVKEVLRYPERKAVYWSPDGNELNPKDKFEERLDGIGFTQEELETAEYIGKNIPSPFIRIDFLKGEKGMYFSEFAPRTGTYDRYYESFDRLLGNEFNKAENRLFNDLYNGKVFEVFKQLGD